jgi:hypothetical protein
LCDRFNRWRRNLGRSGYSDGNPLPGHRSSACCSPLDPRYGVNVVQTSRDGDHTAPPIDCLDRRNLLTVSDGHCTRLPQRLVPPPRPQVEPRRRRLTINERRAAFRCPGKNVSSRATSHCDRTRNRNRRALIYRKAWRPVPAAPVDRDNASTGTRK